ncbi:MAG: hypothetical protein PHR20_00640 [Bacteroidales bacterium]|nr:hypothetical protein [Bacteroidales bacterium]
MKTKRFLPYLLIASAMMTSFISCISPVDPQETTVLRGELTADLTLSSGKTYQLSGGYHVKSGVTLNIEEGVKIVAIDDNIVDYILIEQGAKINAQGSESNPIVMTSEKEESGAWGGLHICGKAPINVTGGTAVSEIGDAVYGGNNISDNSGILRYIRIEYAGYNFSEEKEANGFTFYGVGNGTTAEYMQAYVGSDDGFEWFGGTMDVKYLVSTNNSDDSFDWTQGWRGRGQYLLAYQASKTALGYDCDALIEADNNGDNFTAAPTSHPVLSNLTLIGNNSADEKRGIRLRAGTQAEIYNAIVTGKPNCLTTQTVETENSLINGSSILENILLENTVTSEDGNYSEEMFLYSGTNAINYNMTFNNLYRGTVSGGTILADSFFDAAGYKGAVSSDNDWTVGWTR